MKRRARQIFHHRGRREESTIARVAVGAAGVLAGLLIIRSIPDLVRYVKIGRM